MDFKVKCVAIKADDDNFTEGKIYNVVNGAITDDKGCPFSGWSAPHNGDGDFTALKKWFKRWFDFELVEEKKTFTKSDLKNGDVIVRNNGWVEIVIVDLNVLVSSDGWDSLSDINEDLTDIDFVDFDDEYNIVKVYRPTAKHHCCFNELSYTKGELVYDRERDTKPVEPPKHPYNGKVVCIDNAANPRLHTIGKIYQFKDGKLTADNGVRYPNVNETIYTFEDWAKWTASRFIEIKE